jgi:hypothetical protein
MQYEPWIGIDLDGTLAEHATGRFRENHIGKAIPRMVDKLWGHLNKGDTVKIFTARIAKKPHMRKVIQHWLMMQGIPPLEVTNIKDPGMTKLYDDKAIKVEKNTGKVYNEPEQS